MRKLMQMEYAARCHFIEHDINDGPRLLNYKYRALQRVDTGAGGPVAFTRRSIENLHDILVESSFRLSRPTEFNDLFDTSANLIVAGSPVERQQRFEEIARTADVPVAQMQSGIQNLASRTDAELIAGFQRGLEIMRASMGIYSFAGDPRNILMWAHYADDHRGLCLEFDTAMDFMTLSRAVRVDYIEEYPTLNWISGFRNGIGSLLLRKHPRWVYEDETRIILPDAGGQYLRFLPAALRKIIFGYRAGEQAIEIVQQLLAERKKVGHPEIELCRAVPGDREDLLTLVPL
jgi:Protein of unknown function (DUF2971)